MTPKRQPVNEVASPGVASPGGREGRSRGRRTSRRVSTDGGNRNPSRVEKRSTSLVSGAPCPAHLGFQIHRYRVLLPLLAATLVMSSLMHAPKDQWYLAYVCLVPWLIVVGGTARARRVYVTSWLMGFAFYLINIRWMRASTGAGYVVLSAHLAFYFPVMAWAIRHAVRRRRLPLALVVPVVWVGAEFVRALGLIGFPWFFLAHTQYAKLPMIQISDLFGAYGVSFVLAAVNGAIADVVFARFGPGASALRESQRRRATVGVGCAVVLVVMTLGYGWYQLGRDTMSPGPRIALLQQDYPNYTDPAKYADQPRHYEKQRSYFEMMARAEDEAPDLYLFPETAWSAMHLNTEFLEAAPEAIASHYLRAVQQWSSRYHDLLSEWCARTKASLVIGSMSVTPTPLALRSSAILHNSAFHFRPDGVVERHEKIHPVLFGEMVPFRYGRLRFLYLILNGLSPFGQGGYEYSLSRGEDVRVFTMGTLDGASTYRFGVPICYEDVMPYVVRRFVWDPEGDAKRVGFLLNISNDGWFLHGEELPQHFAICSFRAVENRVGIARTVNTGVSGFIDSNGRAYEKIGVGETGYRVARVMTDSRESLYSRIGDIFAVLCAAAWGLFCVDYVYVRMRSASGSVTETKR